jgi:hypothetical protein
MAPLFEKKMALGGRFSKVPYKIRDIFVNFLPNFLIKYFFFPTMFGAPYFVTFLVLFRAAHTQKQMFL